MKLSVLFQKNIRGSRSSLVYILIFIILIFVHYLATSGKFHVFEYLIYLGMLGAGLCFIRATLLFFVSESAALISIILIVFATNLFYLGGIEPLLQPGLLFFLYAGILYFTAVVYRSPRPLNTIILALFCGITVLVNSTGYLALLVPALWGIADKTSMTEKYSAITRNYRNILVFFACLILIIVLPVIILKVSPGEIGFLDFRLPGIFYVSFRYLWNNLFSFDHGWLTWSPVLLIVIVGFYYLAEKNREIFLSVFVVCVAEVLAVSCWSNLDRSLGFGQIAYVHLLALLSLPVAFSMNVLLKKNNITRYLTAVLFLFFIGLNLFQTWQYTIGIIPKSDMTPDIYGAVFGRTDFRKITEQRLAGADPDISFLLRDESKLTHRVLAFYDFEDTTVSYKSQLETACFKSGGHSFILLNSGPFSPAWKVPYSTLTLKENTIARLTVSVYSPVSDVFKDGYLTFSSYHGAITYRYQVLPMGTLNLEAGKWHTLSLSYLFPRAHDPDDLVAGYVYYSGNSRLYIDDLKFELLEPTK